MSERAGAVSLNAGVKLTSLVARITSTANFAHLAAPLNVSVSQWDQFTVEKEEVRARRTEKARERGELPSLPRYTDIDILRGLQYRENNTDNLQRWIESFDPEAQDGKVTW